MPVTLRSPWWESTSVDPKPSVWFPILVTELTLSTVIALLRIYSKGFLLRRWTWADTTFLLAWVQFFSIVAVGFNYLHLYYILDTVGKTVISEYDYINITVGRINRNTEVIYGLYATNMCFIKVSILLQLIDIFAPIKKGRRWWILWTMIAVNIVFFVGFLISVESVCFQQGIPVVIDVVDDSCGNSGEGFLLATGIFNILDDLFMLALPLYWISKLQIGKKQRINISLLFSFGVVVLLCSIFRLLWSIYPLDGGPWTLFIWMFSELSSALIVSCLPSLPRLFKHSLHGSNDSRKRTWYGKRLSSSSTQEVKKPRPSDEESYTQASVGAAPDPLDIPPTAILKTVHIEQRPE